MNNDKDLFRQALQRQNERSARMKMPDDMEQRVMKSIRPKKPIRRWLFPVIATIAASMLLLLVLRFSQEPVEEQPVMAETMDQEAIKQLVPQPIVEEKQKETQAEVQSTPKPVKKRKKTIRKQCAPAELVQTGTEALLAEAADVFIEEPAPTNNLTDPFLEAAELARDIRSHGERLDRETAQMMIK